MIEGASEIMVKGINNDFYKKYSAKVVATDKLNDLAILKIDSRLETSIKYAIKWNVSEVGQEVFTLGYPLKTSMGEEIKLTNGKYNYFVKVLYDENGKPLDIFVVKSEKNKPDTEHESFDIKLVRFLGTSNKITGIPGFEKINKADIDGDRCCLNCNGWIVCGCAVECDGKTCCVNPCCGIF